MRVEEYKSPEDVQSSRRLGRILPIQYLRAMAAIAVVLYHASHYLVVFRNDPGPLNIFGGWFGSFGVNLFFAISGYLMAELCTKTKPSVFLVHRILRIYPIFWIVALAALVISVMRGGAWLDPLSLTLVPVGPRPYPIGVEWTLNFEIMFYVYVFGIIALGLSRHIALLGTLWLGAITVARFVAPELQPGMFPTILSLPLAETNVAFAAGLIVPFVVRRRLVGPATPLIGLALLVGGEAAAAFWLKPWCFGIGAAWLVSWAVAMSQAQRSSFPTLAALGDWSFALYLVHVPTLLGLYTFAPQGISSTSLWFAGVAASVLLSVFVGKLDLRFYRWLKRRADRASPRALRLICAGFLLVIVSASLVHQWERRTEANVLHATATFSAALSTATSEEIPSIAQAHGWTPALAIQGGAEARGTPGSSLYIHGWIADLEQPRTRPYVLFVYGKRGVAVAKPGSYRSDVARHLGLAQAWIPTTFELSAFALTCAPGEPLVVMALNVRRRTYKLLSVKPAC